jgi:hypothetical protein
MSTYFKDDEISGTNATMNPVSAISTWIQVISDRLHFYKVQRWGVVAGLAFIFIIRLIITKGTNIIDIRIPCRCLLFGDTFTKLIYWFYITA